MLEVSRGKSCIYKTGLQLLDVLKHINPVCVWWLAPVIPALWEAKVPGPLEDKSLRPAWPAWRTPSLLKIQKLARCSGAHLYSQLLGRLRHEDHLNAGGGGCSELRLHHCTICLGSREAVSKKLF
uniref:Uncharacterized protein n=1 Tax=Macaca mulatta TaxID=9544 RepID=A0A5F7ZES6_MACMU